MIPHYNILFTSTWTLRKRTGKIKTTTDCVFSFNYSMYNIVLFLSLEMRCEACPLYIFFVLYGFNNSSFYWQKTWYMKIFSKINVCLFFRIITEREWWFEMVSTRARAFASCLCFCVIIWLHSLCSMSRSICLKAISSRLICWDDDFEEGVDEYDVSCAIGILEGYILGWVIVAM